MSNQIDLVELTRQIMRHLYDQKPDSILPYLDKNLLWIGPLDFQWETAAQKAQRMVRILEEEGSDSCILTDEEYFSVQKSRNHQIVCGKARTISSAETEHKMQRSLRFTFVWKLSKDQWKVTHIHLTQPYEIPQQSASNSAINFPYDDISRLLINKDPEKEHKLMLRDTKGRLHYLFEDEILYLEADNLCCKIILRNDVFTVRKSISLLEQQFSNRFLRIHRSYLVNRHHICCFERFRMEMRNNVWLHIPERRYAAISAALNNEANKKIEKPEFY